MHRSQFQTQKSLEMHNNIKNKNNWNCCIRGHSSITSSKRWVGGVRKWQFLMIYSTVNHQRSGWVGLKSQKRDDVVLECPLSENRKKYNILGMLVFKVWKKMADCLELIHSLTLCRLKWKKIFGPHCQSKVKRECLSKL